MKKLMLIIIAIAVSGVMYSQYDSANKMNPPKDYNSLKTKNYNTSDSLKKQHPDGYVMKDGKVMKIKDGKFTTLDKDVTLSNGTVIMKNGSYMVGENKMMLKEGELLDIQGNVVKDNKEKENWDTDKAKKDNEMKDQDMMNQNKEDVKDPSDNTDRSSIDRSGNR